MKSDASIAALGAGCSSCPASFCGARNSDPEGARAALLESGVLGVRPAAMTAVCTLLFAVPIFTLMLVLPALAHQSAWLQLLAIVTVVSLPGLLARWLRARLLQWLLIRQAPLENPDDVERLRLGTV